MLGTSGVARQHCNVTDYYYSKLETLETLVIYITSLEFTSEALQITIVSSIFPILLVFAGVYYNHYKPLQTTSAKLLFS